MASFVSLLRMCVLTPPFYVRRGESLIRVEHHLGLIAFLFGWSSGNCAPIFRLTTTANVHPDRSLKRIPNRKALRVLPKGHHCRMYH